jgi:hypothetical protein
MKHLLIKPSKNTTKKRYHEIYLISNDRRVVANTTLYDVVSHIEKDYVALYSCI